MGKKLKWLVEFVFVFVFVILFRIFPYDLRVALLTKLLSILSRVFPFLKKRIEENLSECFPNKDLAWRQEMIQKNLMCYGRSVSGYIEMFTFSNDLADRWTVYKPDKETFQYTLSKGGLYVGGHLGSVEHLGLVVAHSLSSSNENTEIHPFVRRMRNPWISLMMDRIRKRNQVHVIYTDENPRRVFSLLKQKHMVGLFADQDAGRAGPFFPFLGRLASVQQGPAFLARLSSVATYFIWSHFDEKSRLIVEFQEIHQPTIDKKTNSMEWERQFTYSWTKMLEEKAKMYIPDYFWAHKRWRHQPEDVKATWDFWQNWEKKNNLPISVMANKLSVE